MGKMSELLQEIKEKGFAFSDDTDLIDAVRYMGYGTLDLNTLLRKKKKKFNMYEAFEAMHKADGTVRGRRDHEKTYDF